MLVKCSGALIDRQTAIYLIVLVLRERLVLAEFFITKKKACKQRPPFINSLILCVDLFWVYLVLIFWGFPSLVSVLDETLSIATKQGVQCNTWRIKWKKKWWSDQFRELNVKTVDTTISALSRLLNKFCQTFSFRVLRLSRSESSQCRFETLFEFDEARSMPDCFWVKKRPWANQNS